MERIVITGLGCVTPLGNTVAPFWSDLIAGRSGIGPLEDGALAAQMSHAGRERVEREFSVGEMVEKTVRAYREVLG